MLTRFELTNYKNFKDTLAIDFTDVGGYQFNPECITNNTIGKMLIYGRNATGKTNLGKAIVDIQQTASSLFSRTGNTFLNADSNCDHAVFSYSFRFGNDNLQYTYGKKAIHIFNFEKLILNGLVIFDFNYTQSNFSYEHLDLIGCETLNVTRYLDNLIVPPSTPIQKLFSVNKPSFLRWLFSNAIFPENSVMMQLNEFIEKMAYFSISGSPQPSLFPSNPGLSNFDKDELKNLENFLNTMGVDCHLESRNLPDGQIQIYFRHNKLIPFFSAASSGTLALFNLYRQIVTRMKDLSFFYLDEYDAFFHYEMSERFLKYVKENFPHCQVILTTHNTNLMTNRIMRPDCVFILSQNGTLTALNKATTRELREGHNLEKLYMSGEFDV